jgi:transposase
VRKAKSPSENPEDRPRFLQISVRPEGKRYFIRACMTDMRKSIGSLASLVENEIGVSPFTEDYFLFGNRKKNIIKILYWHMNGFALWTKRLEEDRFPWPNNEAALLEMTRDSRSG